MAISGRYSIPPRGAKYQNPCASTFCGVTPYATDGNFYGSTSAGGSSGLCGTLFQITPGGP